MYTLEVENCNIEIDNQYTFENQISPKQAFKFIMTLMFNLVDEGRLGVDLHDYASLFNDDEKKDHFVISIEDGLFRVSFSKFKSCDQTLNEFEQDWEESYDWIKFE